MARARARENNLAGRRECARAPPAPTPRLLRAPRAQFNFRFVALFTALLFLKIFHWLMQDRVAFMEQSPAVSYLTHGRMVVLMGLLLALDCAFLHHAVGTSLRSGPSVLLLFAFYACLTHQV